VTRPTSRTYANKRADLLAIAQDLFDVVLSGAIKIEVNQTYPLQDAAKAHQDLQARKTNRIDDTDRVAAQPGHTRRMFPLPDHDHYQVLLICHVSAGIRVQCAAGV
jgi:hypothetical protein